MSHGVYFVYFNRNQPVTYNFCVCVCACECYRRLLYADCGAVMSTVRACSLSADNCHVLLNRTRCVQDLHYDADVNTLYWIEATIIMSCHLAGPPRPEFVRSVCGMVVGKFVRKPLLFYFKNLAISASFCGCFYLICLCCLFMSVCLINQGVYFRLKSPYKTETDTLID